MIVLGLDFKIGGVNEVVLEVEELREEEEIVVDIVRVLEEELEFCCVFFEVVKESVKDGIVIKVVLEEDVDIFLNGYSLVLLVYMLNDMVVWFKNMYVYDNLFLVLLVFMRIFK